MRWTLNVNQKQSLSLGIKNINQSIILGLICECHSWAEAVLIDGQVFFWTSRQSFVKELPLLDLKADTIYRHLKALEQLGLIEYKKDGKKDCVRLTKLGKTYYVGNESENSENSEMNPNKLGNESENNSDLNPTYPYTKSNPNTNIPSCVNADVWNSWIAYRKKRKLTCLEVTLQAQLDSLQEMFDEGIDPNKVIQDSIKNGWQGLFKPKKQQQSYQPRQSKVDVTMETWERVQAMKRGNGEFIEGEIA